MITSALFTLAGRMGSLPISYSGGPEFKFWAMYRLSWLKFIPVCRSLSKEIYYWYLI